MTKEEAEEMLECIRESIEYFEYDKIAIRAHVNSSGECGWCVIIT